MAPRLIQSVFAAFGDLYLYKLSKLIFNEHVAQWTVSLKLICVNMILVSWVNYRSYLVDGDLNKSFTVIFAVGELVHVFLHYTDSIKQLGDSFDCGWTLLLVYCNRVFQGNFSYFKAAGRQLPKSSFKKSGTTHSSLSLRHSANKCHNMVVCWSFGLHLYKIKMSISVSWGHSSRVRSHH